MFFFCRKNKEKEQLLQIFFKCTLNHFLHYTIFQQFCLYFFHIVLEYMKILEIRLGQVTIGQVRLCQVRLGYDRAGQVSLGQARLRQVRLVQERLGQFNVQQQVKHRVKALYGIICNIRRSFDIYLFSHQVTRF